MKKFENFSQKSGEATPPPPPPKKGLHGRKSWISLENQMKTKKKRSSQAGLRSQGENQNIYTSKSPFSHPPIENHWFKLLA